MPVEMLIRPAICLNRRLCRAWLFVWNDVLAGLELLNEMKRKGIVELLNEMERKGNYRYAQRADLEV